MRIVVDLNRCLGYAQCVPLAPEVLQLNGEEALAYDRIPMTRNVSRLRGQWRPARCRRSSRRWTRPRTGRRSEHPPAGRRPR
jgi:hypothetical protein